MASKHSNIPTFNFSQELNVKTVEIQNSGCVNQVPSPDLDDDTKRWLVVGICLHSVISPALRQYVEPVVTQVYKAAQQTHGIQTQTYPQYLKRYPPTNKHLNYESVNENKKNYGTTKKQYDYKITDAVEFSKLFLKNDMAHYTKFDLTCDASALLGIIININKFPQNVQGDAENIRSDIRNEWAHCNLSTWNNLKYLGSFLQMNQLVKNMNLAPADETRILAELSKWELNGLNFLHGTTLGLELVKEFQVQTKSLADYAHLIALESESAFTKVHTELCKIDMEIQTILCRIDKIEATQIQHGRSINDLDDKIEEITNSLAHVKSAEVENKQLIQDLDGQQRGTTQQVQKMGLEILCIRDKQGDDTNRINEFADELSEMKENIEEIKQTNARQRPRGKVLSSTPNRVEHFVGREDELTKLPERFFVHKHVSPTIPGRFCCFQTIRDILAKVCPCWFEKQHSVSLSLVGSVR